MNLHRWSGANLHGNTERAASEKAVLKERWRVHCILVHPIMNLNQFNHYLHLFQSSHSMFLCKLTPWSGINLHRNVE